MKSLKRSQRMMMKLKLRSFIHVNVVTFKSGNGKKFEAYMKSHTKEGWKEYIKCSEC